MEHGTVQLTDIYCLVQIETSPGSGFTSGAPYVSLQLMYDGCQLSTASLYTRPKSNRAGAQQEKMQKRGEVHGGTLVFMLDPDTASLAEEWIVHRDSVKNGVTCAIHVVDPHDEREYAGACVSQGVIYAMPSEGDDKTWFVAVRLAVDALTGTTAAAITGASTLGGAVPYRFSRAEITMGDSVGLAESWAVTVRNNLGRGRETMTGPAFLSFGPQRVTANASLIYESGGISQALRAGDDTATRILCGHTTTAGSVLIAIPTGKVTQAPAHVPDDGRSRGLQDPALEAHKGGAADQLTITVT